ncbi:MAG TPA: amidase family protein [Solirubrobacteraceae bacterium]|jgi:Asp-tRNA(Asn)/Glu-tRNA(Gln) amidotransferase A subunit family amidase
MGDEELCFKDATELATLIAARELSPVEVLDAFLARIDALNPSINAFCVVAEESARDAAARAEQELLAGGEVGPLHGVPVAFKDLTPTAGIETAYGSWIFAGNVPDADAVVVERTKRAGGIVIGKTMTSELGHAACARNLVSGATVNPWNPERIPGGSSGGSAAAVLTAMAPVAEGTDGGGSVRIPASCCGVFGLKPQLGRIPLAEPANFGTLNCHGPLTWTVRDAALLMSVWSGPDERDPMSLPASDEDFTGAIDGDIAGARVAYSADLGLPVDPAVREVVREAVGTLERLGVHISEVELSAGSGLVAEFHRLWIGMEAAVFGDKVERFGERMTRGVREEIARGSVLSAVDYWRAELARSEFYARVRAILAEYDFIVCPVMAVSPPSVHMFTDGPEEVNGEIVDRKTGWSLAFPFNLTSHPAASLPCGFTPDGLPVGMQVVGRRFGERALLALAARFEEAAPWRDRRPPLVYQPSHTTSPEEVARS